MQVGERGVRLSGGQVQARHLLPIIRPTPCIFTAYMLSLSTWAAAHLIEVIELCG